MMHSKRWIVTYTRHMKQKRKVYHDGVIELCGSSDKVMLYDDCEKLIDSRFLKHDEVVEYGASLTFETHLVDIGEPEGRQKPHTDLNVSGRDMKLNEKAGAQGHKNKKNTFQRIPQQNYSNAAHSSIKGNQLKLSSFENKRSKLQNIPSQIHSNAIPSSIRVSNKTEIGSTGVLQGRPNATQTTLKEWDALYTTHITQKAKRYHDGILRLAVPSSHMNQIILLSEDGTVLSSKYVKSVDCVVTGHTCELPNYLVEIGDRRVSLGDDLQKGPLKHVANSGSSSTGKLAITKKDDSIKTLPNDNLQKGPSKQASSSSSSRTGKFTITEKDDGNKNNACQIPSILRKLLREDNLSQTNQPVKHGTSSLSSNFIQLHSSDVIQLDVQKSKMSEHNVPGTRYTMETIEDYHEGDSQELYILGATQTGTSGRPHLSSKATLVPTSGASILIDRDYEGNSAPHEYYTPSNQLSRVFVSNTSSGKLDMEYNGNKCVDVTTSAEEFKNSNASTCTLPGIIQKNAIDGIFAGDGLSKEPDDCEDVRVGKSFGCLANGEEHIADSSISLPKENISIESSSLSGIGRNGISSVNAKYENPDKIFAENTKAELRCQMDPSLDESPPGCSAKDAGCKDSKVQNLSNKCLNVDNFPTFDLGF